VIDESPVGIGGSTPPAEGPPDIDLRAVDGRLPGRRGLATRKRLLAATASLLETTGYRDLKVVEVAREAGTSPATFYQYFPDAESAVLVLAAELAEAWHYELATLVADGDWMGNPDGAARHASEGFLDFWTTHRAVLGVLDLASTEGDERFRDLRTRLLNGPTAAMVDVAVASGAAGDPMAAAGVLVAMLAHVSNHQVGLERWGVDRSALVTTMAGVLRRTLVA